MNRRDFFKFASVAGLAALHTGAVGRLLAQDAPARDRVGHVINRLTFGITPDLYEYVHQIGVEAYIEEQLNPDRIDNGVIDDVLSFFPSINMTAAEMLREYGFADGAPIFHLVGATIARAIYSRQQLYERMVGFWSDHFNIHLLGEAQQFLKPVDDRDVVRQHAVGRFRDLLGASAHSPAMLLYLDNALSQGTAPNENYGRELLELHTLGVNGGYSEEDVRAVARAFTGWSIVAFRDIGEPGLFRFRADFHDDEAKTVLGVTLPAGQGEQDGEQVLDLLAAHPSTARFIATKLARRFVADFPDPALVDRAAATFMQTGGDIRETLRAIFTSEQFWNAPPKLKRPFEYTVSIVRALDIPPLSLLRSAEQLFAALEGMGQVPFFWPAPNGYPDVSAYWSNNLLPRWNAVINAVLEGGQFRTLARLVENQNANRDLDSALRFLGRYLFGRDLSDLEFSTARDFAQTSGGDLREQVLAGVALLMAAPAFQYA